jgi:diguanylate cyclase (GGDEF)-like protein/PAS domain S-box-containing protein
LSPRKKKIENIKQTLKKKEQQLLEAQRIAHLGFWERDLVRDEIYWSDEVYSILGIDPEAYIPSAGSISDFIHPEDFLAFNIVRSKALFENIPFNHEYRIIRPDGRIRHIHGRSETQYDEQGKPVRFSGTIIDITETRQLAEKLDYKESHDSVTGLLNRISFEKLLQNALIPRRSSHDVIEHVLCYVAVRQLKYINDSFGHEAGDELLRQVAFLLCDKFRKRDVLARLSGGKFGILMEYCTLEDADRVLGKLREAMDTFEYNWLEKPVHVSTGIGVIQVNSDSGNLIEIMAKADLACDMARETSGNQIYIYTQDDDMLGRKHDEMLWVERINHALRNDRLLLYYQPIVSLKDTIHDVHYELLVRMQDDYGNIILPGAFLPAADRYNLTGAIDRWVINTTLNWLHTSAERISDQCYWGINLSGHSLADDSLLNFVLGEMERYQIPPYRIYFEITETAAITNLKNALHFINSMMSRGSHFALDDFGSGLSSFGYLKNLPVDFLKIDGLFVREIANNLTDYAMVKAINDVGRVMGKKIIAEFAENDQIIEKLKAIGVDYAQGYGICKPKPLAEFLDLKQEDYLSV